jgi:4-hydroxy-tetrahydrodipicolinate synthase
MGTVMAALATPLEASGSGRLDLFSLGRLVDHIVAGGADGLCPAGSTGEGPLLARETRVALVQAVAGMAPGGTPVIPGTLSVNAEATLADIDAYADAGATAVLVPPPFYYPLSDGSVADFYLYVAERSALPVLIYNIPAMTKVSVAPAVTEELSRHPHIAGMKDSSRDMEYFSAVAARTANSEDFCLLTGSDTLLSASLAAGGKGTIAASVNLVPGLVRSLYAASISGDPTARALQGKLAEVVFACRRPGFPAGWKAALKLAGLCEATLAAPLREASEAATATLAQELRATLGEGWDSPKP